MSERETTFENARVGDRVYSPLFKCKNFGDKTNAVITLITPFAGLSLSVKPDVPMKLDVTDHFSIYGNIYKEGGQLLFWENPIKEIPVRPKRKVIKKGYFVVKPCRKDDGIIGIISTDLYDNPTYLLYGIDDKRLVEIEIEVEE